MLAAHAGMSGRARPTIDLPRMNAQATQHLAILHHWESQTHLRQVRHDSRHEQNMSVVDRADVDEDQIWVWPNCGGFGVRGLLSGLHLVQHLLLQSLAEVELRRVKRLHHLQHVTSSDVRRLHCQVRDIMFTAHRRWGVAVRTMWLAVCTQDVVDVQSDVLCHADDPLMPQQLAVSHTHVLESSMQHRLRGGLAPSP
jgi:hypothetical protein